MTVLGKGNGISTTHVVMQMLLPPLQFIYTMGQV